MAIISLLDRVRSAETKNVVLKCELDKAHAIIEYLSMMTDVEIPEDVDPEVTEDGEFAGGEEELPEEESEAEGEDEEGK